MEGQERRRQLLQLLEESNIPISGTELAKKLGVSRQVIVQDIALLRAENKNIVGTTRGYLFQDKKEKKCTRTFLVKHTTEQIEDELCTIVDYGGRVIKVQINHDIYGAIQTNLPIKTREDIILFVKQVKEKKVIPLKELTKGIHSHVVEAESEEILDEIQNQLKEKKYLIIK